MPEVTYDSIKPLITEEESDGDYMKCVFTCPSTGKAVKSRAQIKRSKAGAVMDRGKSSAARTVKWKLRYGIIGFVSRLLGHGILGRVGRDIAYEATDQGGLSHNTPQKINYSDKEKQAAVVEAFKVVEAQFTWDEESGQWKAVVEEKESN